METSPRQKILILSCGTGEGHNSAARAIADELSSRSVPFEIRNILDFKSKKAADRASRAYGNAIRHTPHLFGCVYTLGCAYDKLRLPSVLYKLNEGSKDALHAYVEEGGFTHIVCTHLFAMETVTAMRRKYGAIPSFAVITDYTIHPFVKDTDLDGYFVPTPYVEKQFFALGFDASRVHVSGIPVRPLFREHLPREEARKQLSLPEKQHVVLIMTGGEGCGKTGKLCKKLLKKERDLLVVVLTGKNEKLLKTLEKRLGNAVRAVPFTEDVQKYLCAADCVVSKSGGLSSTEIASLGAPLVHLKSVPGLETANLKYFSENGLSLRADSKKEAIKKVQLLLADELLAEEMRKKQTALIHPFGAQRIADEILR